MTNGEKIKEIFPQANIKMPTIFETKVKVIIDLDCEVKFPIEWWDAEYKEPTTKNDLEVEYITKQAAIDCLDYTDGELPITKIKNLPSVTPLEPRKADKEN